MHHGRNDETIGRPRETTNPSYPGFSPSKSRRLHRSVIGKGGEIIQDQAEPAPSSTSTRWMARASWTSRRTMRKRCKKPMNGSEHLRCSRGRRVYHGKVVSILEFGAFVESSGKKGAARVRNRMRKTENVSDVLHRKGDEVDVKLLKSMRRPADRLSMRALAAKPEGYVERNVVRGGAATIGADATTARAGAMTTGAAATTTEADVTTAGDPEGPTARRATTRGIPKTPETTAGTTEETTNCFSASVLRKR